MEIVIEKNTVEANKAIQEANYLATQVNKALAKFKIEINYPLSIHEIRTLISGSQDSVWHVHENVEKYLDAELNRLNVVGDLFRKNFKTGFHQSISNFEKDLKKLQSHLGYGNISQLTMLDGKVVLSPKEEAIIRKSFENVIVSPDAKELYDLQNQAAEALQPLYTFVKNKTIIQFTGLTQMMQGLFSVSEKGEVQINILAYEMAVNKSFQPAV